MFTIVFVIVLLTIPVLAGYVTYKLITGNPRGLGLGRSGSSEPHDPSWLLQHQTIMAHTADPVPDAGAHHSHSSPCDHHHHHSHVDTTSHSVDSSMGCGCDTSSTSGCDTSSTSGCDTSSSSGCDTSSN